MNRRQLFVVFSIFLSALFLWLAFRHVPMPSLLEILASTHPQWVLAILAIIFLDLFIRALRWQALLSFVCPQASWPKLLCLEAAGLAVNNVLFMRLGELARALLASRELKIPLSASLSSVAIERALDLGSLLFLFAIVAPFYPKLVPQTLRHSVLFFLFLTISALIFLIFAEEKKDFLISLVNRSFSRWPRVSEMFEGLFNGAAALKNLKTASFCVTLSLALWCADALTYWAGAKALGISLGYPGSILVLSWAAAASALPAAPGSFGAFEVLVENIMVKLKTPLNSSLAFALLTHATMYLTVTLFGLFCLSQIGFSLADISAQTSAIKEKN
jgi:hypothetical protein